MSLDNNKKQNKQETKKKHSLKDTAGYLNFAVYYNGVCFDDFNHFKDNSGQKVILFNVY